MINGGTICLYLCPGRELNPHLSLRSALFYPLNYQGDEGIISKKKLDSIRFPLYNPSHSEVVRVELPDREERKQWKRSQENNAEVV